MAKGYTCYEITKSSRKMLLGLFVPKFPKVICHHITWEFGVDGSYLPPSGVEIEALIEVWDERMGVHALSVSVGSNPRRPDGGWFHVTMSLDESLGAKPVMSNKLFPFGNRTTFNVAKPGIFY